MPQGSDNREENRDRSAETAAPAGRLATVGNVASTARCLVYVLRRFGVECDAGQLERALTTDVPGGEVVNLLAVAARHGLHARSRIVADGTWEDLTVGALLQWGGDGVVVYMGHVAGDALVYDPVTDLKRVARDDFDRNFTGVAVEFGREADAGRA